MNVQSTRASVTAARARGAQLAAQRDAARAAQPTAPARAAVMPAAHEVLAAAVRAVEATPTLGVISAVIGAARELAPAYATDEQVRDLRMTALAWVTAQTGVQGAERLTYAYTAAALSRAQVGVTIIAPAGR